MEVWEVECLNTKNRGGWWGDAWCDDSESMLWGSVSITTVQTPTSHKNIPLPRPGGRKWMSSIPVGWGGEERASRFGSQDQIQLKLLTANINHAQWILKPLWRSRSSLMAPLICVNQSIPPRTQRAGPPPSQHWAPAWRCSRRQVSGWRLSWGQMDHRWIKDGSEKPPWMTETWLSMSQVYNNRCRLIAFNQK